MTGGPAIAGAGDDQLRRWAAVGRRFDLGGRVVLVTGGSQGVGLALARVMGEAGAAVAVLARRSGPLEEAVADLAARGISAVGVRADVAVPAERERAVDEVHTALGPVDVLVNNAGVPSSMRPLLDCPPDHWQRLLDVNVTAYVEMARLCAPAMLERGWGRILNVTSSTALKARARMGEYGTTKAAEVMITRVLAVELGARGVTVNALAPILMRTEFSSRQWQEQDEVDRVLRLQAIPRMCEPEDLAGVALLLASDAGAFITGVTIPIDGGALA